ncbi:Ubiquitin-related domain [Lasallia pustulata]|uniref:Ubiquitin-related domain n=1 Tax=Lasallia pustulata TaxID=136370 RepID=A0A1W5D4F2_9LECA|nr:Ubiquitin-related domain [Lasallia pustulata]
MANTAAEHDSLITQFCSLTGVVPQEAQEYLATNQWDLSSAAAEYYTSLEEGAAEEPGEATNAISDADDEENPVTSAAGGGRTLGGTSGPQPIPTTSSVPPPPSSSSRQAPQKKFATLGDFSGGGGSGQAGPGHNDNEDDDDNEKQDLFAGGVKSGLAVQNPNKQSAADIQRKILQRARKDVARPGGDDPRAPSSRFTGTARTLGGDDTPSQVIEDPTARMPQRQPRVERQLHFWADGFSVDDGPLYRSDDPANAGYLSMIREGHAPLAIMNVTRNQEVDVKLVQHEEKYVAPKKKYKPFSGSGQRLGSPTPGADGSTYSDAAAAPASEKAPELAGGALSTVGVNESQPTITLQIRLGDGTRLSSRFNTTHTIGDVYDFVYASNTASRGRLWVLMTTFPSRELSDKEIALGDLAEFKRGGVVVQKWT